MVQRMVQRIVEDSPAHKKSADIKRTFFFAYTQASGLWDRIKARPFLFVSALVKIYRFRDKLHSHFVFAFSPRELSFDI
jgi:hypothetical protein